MDRPDWIDAFLPALPAAGGGRPDAFPIEPEPDPLSEDSVASDKARLSIDEHIGADTPLMLAGGGNPPAQIKDPATGGLMLPSEAFEHGLGSHANPAATARLDGLFGRADLPAGDDAAMLAPAAGPCVPIIVTNTNDAGPGSLRQAVFAANSTAGADTIQFAAGLAGLNVILTSGELSITDDLIINGDTDGDGDNDVRVSGNDASRIFNISGSGTDVDLVAMFLRDGNSAGNGGAVLAGSGTTLDVVDTTVAYSAAAAGGGIFSNGTAVSLTNSTLFLNNASNGAGAFFSGGTATLTNTTFFVNYATNTGGGLTTANGQLLIYNSSIVGNDADTDGPNTNAGGGLYNGYSTVTIVNSVIADNHSNSGLTPDDLRESINGASTHVTSSFFGVDESAAFETDVNNLNGGGDPGLGGLTSSGGTVYTLEIEPGSLLIGNGDAALLPADMADLDGDGNTGEDLPVAANGVPRVFGTEGLDIGASEAATVLVVDTLADEDDGNYGAGDLSLREAVSLALAGGTITFDASLAGGTITLGGSELALTQDVTISGDGASGITISGADASRIFDISTSAAVDLDSLTLTNGYSAAPGGAISVASGSTLTLSDSTVQNSYSGSLGGGIRNAGNLTAVNSTFTGNSADGSAGALYNSNGSAILTNVTIHGNDAGGVGGGIVSLYGPLTLNNSTITGNTSGGAGGGLEVYQGTITVNNTVIAGNTGNYNTAPVADDFFDYSAYTTVNVSNSFFGTDEQAAFDINVNNINAGGDPLLGELLNNGGAVLTRSPLDGSPLIGAGSNALLPSDDLDIDGDMNTAEDLPLDGRDILRIVAGTVDIGAVERIANETITGTDGNNTIIGGNGNDILAGLGGMDILDGGNGNDTADYGDSPGGVQILLWNGTGTGGHAAGDTLISIENVIGSDKGDLLAGNSAANVLDGGKGKDVLNAGGGNDVLIGGTGMDDLLGGNGTDTADYRNSGAAVEVRLWNGTGLGGEAEGDTLDGIENVVGSIKGDLLAGDAGANRLDGRNSGDTINAGGGNDVLIGGGGIDLLIGGAGADDLIGGNGIDTADYTNSGAGVTVRLWNGTGTGGEAQGDTLAGIENVTGSTKGDVLAGDSAANVLDGGKGNDLLNAGSGNDTLTGGTGMDDLLGGGGSDTADYRDSGAAVQVRLWNNTGIGGEAEGDTLDSIENVVGSAKNDLLAGDAAANRLDGRSGADTINAGAGNDDLIGGGGNDTLIGGTGKDDLIGGNGIDKASYRDSGAGVEVRLWNGTGLGGEAQGDTLDGIENVDGSNNDDLLAGDGAANVLKGFAGNDTINAGAGNDTVTGGGGNDTFIFGNNSGVNTITDFGANNAEDIDLSAVTAITSFADLVNNHLVNAGGTALIVDGANSILLTGVTVAEFGAGLAYSGNDFIF